MRPTYQLFFGCYVAVILASLFGGLVFLTVHVACLIVKEVF